MVFEEFYSSPGPGGQKAGSNLKPERIRTTELIAEYYPSADLRIVGNLFRYAVRDLIEAGVDPVDGLQVFGNSGSARTTGAGLEIERRWPSGARLRASYSLQRAADRMGAWLVNSPRNLFKGNAVLPLGAGWVAGAELRYTSKRRTLAGEIPGYAIGNLNVTLPAAIPGLELSASLYNIFDKRYADPGGPEHAQDSIRQDGRTFLARLRHRF